MTVRPILEIGDPELRQRAAPVDPDAIASEKVQSLIDDLIDTMRHNHGAGLAATQIGVHLRIAVMEVGDNPRYPYKPRIPLTIAINPEVEAVGDETVEINEGCLSIPLRGTVPRHVTIRARYLNREGTAKTETIRGLTAGTWQHEIDHLDGILFVDRVTDTTTLSTWNEFNQHHRDAFIERITEFNERLDS